MSRPLSLLLRFGLVVVLGVASIAIITSLVVPRIGQLPEAASFEPSSNIVLPELLEGSRILDMNGDPMGELVGAENRQVVPLTAISDELRQTVLAVEDADFYRHNGVSARSVLRALRANSEAGGVSQGGSTITQQLVKLSLVGDETTISRKVKEASLAIQLEEQFCEGTPKEECKDRILEQYLNLVYLGRGAYGVEAASQVYFGRPAAELGWAESAVIAALIRNPNGYDPIRYPELAADRREIVTGRLVDEGLIGEAEADLINAAPLPTDVQNTASSASAQELSYYERKVRDELLDAEWLGPTEELRRYRIFNGGLTITSTMDPRAQFFAQLASEENPVAALNPESVAVVASVEPSTGAVRAVVGETTIEGQGTVELALPTEGRSPGSSMKTFTLLAALEEGYGVRSSISASPAPRSLYDDWDLPDDTSSWSAATRWPTSLGGSASTPSPTTPARRPPSRSAEAPRYDHSRWRRPTPPLRTTAASTLRTSSPRSRTARATCSTSTSRPRSRPSARRSPAVRPSRSRRWSAAAPTAEAPCPTAARLPARPARTSCPTVATRTCGSWASRRRCRPRSGSATPPAPSTCVVVGCRAAPPRAPSGTRSWTPTSRTLRWSSSRSRTRSATASTSATPGAGTSHAATARRHAAPARRVAPRADRRPRRRRPRTTTASPTRPHPRPARLPIHPAAAVTAVAVMTAVVVALAVALARSPAVVAVPAAEPSPLSRRRRARPRRTWGRDSRRVLV